MPQFVIKAPSGRTITIIGTMNIGYFLIIEKLIEMKFDYIGQNITDWDFYYKKFVGE